MVLRSLYVDLYCLKIYYEHVKIMVYFLVGILVTIMYQNNNSAATSYWTYYNYRVLSSMTSR